MNLMFIGAMRDEIRRGLINTSLQRGGRAPGIPMNCFNSFRCKLAKVQALLNWPATYFVVSLGIGLTFLNNDSVA